MDAASEPEKRLLPGGGFAEELIWFSEELIWFAEELILFMNELTIDPGKLVEPTVPATFILVGPNDLQR